MNYVYNEILNNLTKFIVIYGWSMSDYDKHLMKRIFQNKGIRKIAVSIHFGEKTLQEIQEEKTEIKRKIEYYNKNIVVEFWKC